MENVLVIIRTFLACVILSGIGNILEIIKPKTIKGCLLGTTLIFEDFECNFDVLTLFDSAMSVKTLKN